MRQLANRLLSFKLCLVALTFFPAMTGCTAFNNISQSLFMMTPEQEIEFGRKAAIEVEKEIKAVNDAQLNDYMQDLCARIWAASPKSQIPARFHIIDNSEINAFAIPGGDVYIQTGLINAADDEAELAAVIAHEIGHVVNRHGVKAISRQTGASVLQQLALGDDSGEAVQMVSSIVSSGVMFNYSRTEELQADAAAVGTLHRMGYDPAALSTFFKKLTDKYGDNSSQLAVMFSSHPPNEARISQVRSMVNQLRTIDPKQYDRPITGLRRAQVRLEKLGLGQ